MFHSTMFPITGWVLLGSCFLVVSLQQLQHHQCRISEYACENGRCISLDRFCNEYDDCGDKSDEPRYCSPCNRTYYGDIGTSYEIEVRRPREDRLPFLCFLNFTAGGAQYGDLIQLTFDTFTVGKFISYTSDGCPDGHMAIQEEARPSTGQWCGSAWGYTVYYSETRSINLTLNLLRLSEQGIGYNFDFKISYKFLNRFESHLRYGNTSLSIFRGDLIKNTYCDRLFYNCDKLKCRIQSPNYPGVYPRNVTCYYKIEHNIPVKNKQVLITVSQPKGHKINIKHQHIHDKTQRMLKVWDQCYVVQDYLTVYDGGTTLDPVLVRLCGGDVVPDITTSGSQMLLEFHSSAYDNPFHPVPLSYLPGFELQVEISYVDLKSNSYVQKSATSNGRRACNFHLTSFDTGWGMLSNPKHSLPPNTSCVYHFQGRSEERVWLSFVKYYAGESQQGAGLTNMAATGGEGLSNMVTSGGEGLSNMATVSGGECNTRLKIYDGRVGVSSTAQTTLSNTSILGDFCNRDDAMPRLCDHTLLSNRTRFTRPCNSHESYVSSSNEMTLELNMKLGSILYPLNFLLRYEFVSDTPDASVETSAPTDCFKRYNSKSSPLKGKLESTRSVFYFGRGGNENLTCIYRFDTNGTERIRLSVHKTRFNQRKCRTVNANCVYENRNELSELSIYEIPYDSFKIKRQCICESLNATIMVTSYMNSSLLLNFTVLHMNITQDYNHFSFDGDYEFLAQPDASEFNKTANIIQGKSGKINFNTALVGRKYNFPYLIVPEDNNNYLYLKISGFLIINHLFSTCNQKYLINVYTYFNSNREPIVICPMNYRSKVANSKASSKDLYFSPIEMFSYGWNNDINRSKLDLNVFNPLINSFILEFVPVNITSLAVRSDGLGFATGSEFDYMVEWIQVSKILAMNSYALTSSTMDCLYRCPEINACISAELWCDRKRHCPSGFDEEDANCSSLLALGSAPLLYLCVGAATLLALSCLIILTACVKFRRGNKQGSAVAGSKQSVQISASNHYHNGNSKKYLPSSDDYYMDVTVKDAGIC